MNLFDFMIPTNIYQLAIAKATPEEAAKLIEDMAAETERYRKAFCAARAFIRSHAADPDITEEMVEKYAEYQEAAKGL